MSLSFLTGRVQVDIRPPDDMAGRAPEFKVLTRYPGAWSISGTLPGLPASGVKVTG